MSVSSSGLSILKATADKRICIVLSREVYLHVVSNKRIFAWGLNCKIHHCSYEIPPKIALYGNDNGNLLMVEVKAISAKTVMP